MAERAAPTPANQGSRRVDVAAAMSYLAPCIVPAVPDESASIAAFPRPRLTCRASAPRKPLPAAAYGNARADSRRAAPAIDRFEHRTAGLLSVGAVAETASPASARCPRTPHSTADSSTQGCSSRMPGVSMSNAPPGSSISCARSSCAAPCRRPRAPRPRLLIVAEQPIDQRRFADPRRPEQRDRRGRREVRTERRQAACIQRAHGQDVDKRQSFAATRPPRLPASQRSVLLRTTTGIAPVPRPS